MEWGRRNPARLHQNWCEMPQPKTRFRSDGAACLTGAGLIQNGTLEAWAHVEWVGLWNVVVRQMVQESLISSPELPYTVVVRNLDALVKWRPSAQIQVVVSIDCLVKRIREST